MSTRVIFPLALALLGALFVANASSQARTAEPPAAGDTAPNGGPGQATPPAPPESAKQGLAGNPFENSAAENLPVLNHWFALGSGCRAKDDLPGDVSMELLPQDPARPNTFRARFHLEKFRLDPAALADRSLLKFARECSIRLNINPPKGKRITRVAATTAIAVDKAQGTKLTALSELKIGNATLGHDEAIYAPTELIQSKQSEVNLVPGTRLDEPFPDLLCAEPKIIGFNYTWLAERSAASEDVSVQLAGGKTLDIEAELSTCQ